MNASGENEVSPRRASGKNADSVLLGVRQSRTVTATASDGAVVEITGALPRGAEAKIEPVTLTKDELIQYYGADFVDAVDELVVYDICILVDGKEWEPDKSVSVVIKSPAIEVKESAEEVAVTHLDDAKKSAETVETALTEDGELRFETDSFSLWGLFTYTVDYYLNDNEYHQPGNTSMLLSALFEELACPYQASEVAELTFTDDTLLAIERLEEDDDWRLTSLKPFTSYELLTVTLEDGSFFSIEVEDYLYTPLEYDSSLMSPYAGTFVYHGHYDIFGGGNGFPFSNGNSGWGYSGPYGGYRYWSGMNGQTNGHDPSGAALVGETGKYKSGSSAAITWEGELIAAYLSFGPGYFTMRVLEEITLYAPDWESDPSGITTIKVRSNGTLEEDGRPPVGGTMSWGWQYLTFDVTPFVSAHGPGSYSAVYTVSPLEGFGNPRFAESGWTIYGVSQSPDFSYAAVVGVIDESTVSGSNTIYGKRNAVANYPEAVTPKGNGKIWFGMHGGEPRQSGRQDEDYLKLRTGPGNDDFLYLGSGSEAPSNILPVKEGWLWNDIAKPNTMQTPPAGRPKYANRFSFGLGHYENLSMPAVLGISKEMCDGNDRFGSLILMTEVKRAEGSVDLAKELVLDGNGFTDVLPSDSTFSFTITPVDGAPAPVTNDVPPVPNLSSTVTLPAGSQSSDLATISFGTFVFNDAGTFVYEITEDAVSAPWIRDTRTLLLTLEVVENTDEQRFEIQSETWSVKNDPSDTHKYFINKYDLSARLDVEKTDVEGNAVSGAKFLLYSNAGCTTVADVYIDAAMTTALTSANTPATGSNGIASFYGLDKDKTYYLKEVSVPSPYILDSTVVTIAYNASAGQWEQDGSAMDAQLDGTNGIGVLSLTRVNEKALVEITVTKIWDDNNSSRRPTSVDITLSGSDGSSLTVTLDGTAENAPTGTDPAGYESAAWVAKFVNLPEFDDDGTAITYTVSEDQVPGYQKPVISGGPTSFTVTNRLRTSNSPFTGDNRAWLPWVGLLVLSGVALGVDAIVRKRKRRERD